MTADNANWDLATTTLRLAERLHAARADSAAWLATLTDCRAAFPCVAAILAPSADFRPTPDVLEALAGRFTHCAGRSPGPCAEAVDQPCTRGVCRALAPHFHHAANAARDALRTELFDALPPTWILDRHGHVLDANLPARRLSRSAPVTVLASELNFGAAEDRRRLSSALPTLAEPMLFAWQAHQGGDLGFLLRPLSPMRVAATLTAPPDSALRTRQLRQRFGLTARQGELAVHLVSGLTLAAAARAMGITRHTANEHLLALTHRCGAESRAQLLQRLRTAIT